ncbi:hypothetical protein EON65_45165 [archaeon]|nr:MAG: hypothetical protein EON65_45165 [archaeon]
MLYRCEELRKEIHALWERNRSLLQSPPTQPVLSEEERLKDASAQGRGGENEEGMVEEEIEGGRQGRELNVRDGEDITGLHQ